MPPNGRPPDDAPPPPLGPAPALRGAFGRSPKRSSRAHDRASTDAFRPHVCRHERSGRGRRGPRPEGGRRPESRTLAYEGRLALTRAARRREATGAPCRPTATAPFET
jgi:hypothetical protein